jgi:hypothetical protein
MGRIRFGAFAALAITAVAIALVLLIAPVRAQDRPSLPIKMKDFADALNGLMRKNDIDLRIVKTECSPALCRYSIGEFSQAIATGASEGSVREITVATSVPKQVQGQAPRYLGVFLAIIELLSKGDDVLERIEVMKTMMRGATGAAKDGTAELRGVKYKLSAGADGLWLFASPAR